MEFGEHSMTLWQQIQRYTGLIWFTLVTHLTNFCGLIIELRYDRVNPRCNGIKTAKHHPGYNYLLAVSSLRMKVE